MKKKKYIIPSIEVVRINSEHIMISASPGVGGELPDVPVVPEDEWSNEFGID